MAQAADAWKKVYDLANTKLVQMGTADQVVSAVIEHNNMGKRIDDIKTVDKEYPDVSMPALASFLQFKFKVLK